MFFLSASTLFPPWSCKASRNGYLQEELGPAKVAQNTNVRLVFLCPIHLEISCCGKTPPTRVESWRSSISCDKVTQVHTQLDPWLWFFCVLNPSPKKCQSEAPPPPMSMTIDLPQCQEQRRGGGGPKKMSVWGGPGLTFPNVKNDAGASTKAQKSSCFFWGESVAGQRRRLLPPHFCQRPPSDFFFFWGGGGVQNTTLRWPSQGRRGARRSSHAHAFCIGSAPSTPRSTGEASGWRAGVCSFGWHLRSLPAQQSPPFCSRSSRAMHTSSTQVSLLALRSSRDWPDEWSQMRGVERGHAIATESARDPGFGGPYWPTWVRAALFGEEEQGTSDSLPKDSVVEWPTSCVAAFVDVWFHQGEFLVESSPPDLTDSFAVRHDEDVWSCMRTILGSPTAPLARVISTLLLSAGGLGLTSAQRSRGGAHWASWADCIRMVKEQHPAIAEMMITRRSKPTLAKPYGQTDFGQTDFGQTDFGQKSLATESKVKVLVVPVKILVFGSQLPGFFEINCSGFFCVVVLGRAVLGRAALGRAVQGKGGPVKGRSREGRSKPNLETNTHTWNPTPWNRETSTHATQHTHTPHTIQHTTHNTQHTTHNTQHTTHNTQHTTHNTQHTTHNTQHTTHNTQHTTHNTQHTTQHHTTPHHTTPHTTPHHTRHNTPHTKKSNSIWPKSVWPKSVWPKSVWQKSVLATVGFGQSRFGQSRLWPKSAIPLKH